jgi:hypothetical protein
MISLDDSSIFVCVLDMSLPWAHTYADMRPGRTDKERRERYRREALKVFTPPTVAIDWWAFRITVTKCGRLLDLDNVPKPIIDSFCTRQIIYDKSEFLELGFYPDDGLDQVRHIELFGKPGDADTTRIEVFGHIASKSKQPTP